MSAQEDVPGDLRLHQFDGAPQSRLIFFRAAAYGWTLRALLSEGKITAQDRDSRFAKGVRQRSEERRATVGSSAVRQDESIARWRLGRLKEADHGGLPRRAVDEFANLTHIYEACCLTTAMVYIGPYPRENLL